MLAFECAGFIFSRMIFSLIKKKKQHCVGHLCETFVNAPLLHKLDVNLSHSSFRRQRCVRLIREYWCHRLDNCAEIRSVTPVVYIWILQIIF